MLEYFNELSQRRDQIIQQMSNLENIAADTDEKEYLIQMNYEWLETKLTEVDKLIRYISNA